MLVVSYGSGSGGGVDGGGGSGSCEGGNCGGGNDFDYDEVRYCLACDTEDTRRKEDHSIKDSR